MDRDSIAERLVDILTSARFSALHLDPATLHDDTSLLDDVVMDSIQLLEFIVGIERVFGFRASSKDLTLDVFERWSRVIDFVHRSVALPASQAGGPHV